MGEERQVRAPWAGTMGSSPHTPEEELVDGGVAGFLAPGVAYSRAFP